MKSLIQVSEPYLFASGKNFNQDFQSHFSFILNTRKMTVLTMVLVPLARGVTYLTLVPLVPVTSEAAL